jgi:hypothetical protein
MESNPQFLGRYAKRTSQIESQDNSGSPAQEKNLCVFSLFYSVTTIERMSIPQVIHKKRRKCGMSILPIVVAE